MKEFNLLKHTEKITKKASAARPILKCLAIQDGYIYATDSHRAIRYKTNQENMVINPNTLEKVEGIYPEMFRLFPKYDFNKVVSISDYKTMIPFAKQKIDKLHGDILLTYDYAAQTITLNNRQSKMTIQVTSEIKENFKILFNRAYILAMLQAFEDYENNTISMQFEGPVRPALFAASEDFSYLVTPIRVNNDYQDFKD